MISLNGYRARLTAFKFYHMPIIKDGVLHAGGLLLAAATAAGTLSITDGVRTFSVIFVLALAHAVVFGLPIYLLVCDTGRPRWSMALVGGWAVGALPIGLLTLVPAADHASHGDVATIIDGSRTLAGWLEYLSLIMSAGGLGAASGLVFALTIRSTLPQDEHDVLARTSCRTRRTWAVAIAAVITTFVAILAICCIADTRLQ